MFAYACLRDMDVWGLDIEAAYLQCPFDGGDDTPHFLELCDEAIAALPSEIAIRFKDLRRPVVKMQKALYGHPRSGAIFINTLIQHLETGGWRKCLANSAVMVKDEDRLAMYVDDVSGAGPSIQSNAWDWIEKRSTHSGIEKVSAIVGLQITQQISADHRIITFSTEMYICMVVNAYKVLFKVNVVSARSPLTIDPRRIEKSGSKTPKHLLSAVQQIIGMLLWVVRCGRFDANFSVSQLASCVHCWNDELQLQTTRLVPYLWTTKNHVLTYRARRDLAGKFTEFYQNVAYSDADLRTPRSQSSVVVCASNGTDQLVIDMFSRKQSICCENVATSEMLAAHVACKEAFAVSEFFVGRFTPLFLRLDSQTVEQIFGVGWSKPMTVFAAALDLRINFLHDMYMRKHIITEHVAGEVNIANIGTKVRGPIDIERERLMLGIEVDGGATSKRDVPKPIEHRANLGCVDLESHLLQHLEWVSTNVSVETRERLAEAIIHRKVGALRALEGVGDYVAKSNNESSKYTRTGTRSRIHCTIVTLDSAIEEESVSTLRSTMTSDGVVQCRSEYHNVNAGSRSDTYSSDHDTSRYGIKDEEPTGNDTSGSGESTDDDPRIHNNSHETSQYGINDEEPTGNESSGSGESTDKDPQETGELTSNDPAICVMKFRTE